MFVKKIVDICIKKKIVVLFDSAEGQWLLDGSAIYPLWEMPKLDEMTFYAVFDIAKKKREKIVFRHLHGLPPTFDFRDAVDRETECVPIGLTISEGDVVLRPFVTSNGLAFFDNRYFGPVSDSPPEMLKLFERVTTKGNSYFVIKQGLLLYGIILPSDVISETMIENLTTLQRLAAVALENKKKRAGSDEA